MKNIKTLCFLVLSFATLISCSNEPEIGSTITEYPIITVSGPNPYFVTQGTAYVDPGATAKAGSATLPVITTAVGKYRGATTLDTNKADEYTVTYTATNSDGFAATATRKVIVYKNGDLTNSIEGLYLSTTRRNGSLLPASQGSSVGMKYVHIWKNTDGTYSISDAIGGYYSIGRAYGDAYNATGLKITATDIASNNFSFNSDVSVGTFGGALTIKSLTVDATNKQLVLSSTWASGYDFKVTLKQVNF